MTSKLKLGTAAIFVAASSLVSAIASAQQVGHLAEHAKMLLSKGEHERIVPLFRYFEESVSPAEVYGDKRAVLTFFVLLRDYFGRLDRVVASSSTSLTYINIYIESATPDLWRKSTCGFREQVFRGDFTNGAGYRQAEILFTICFHDRLQKEWLRKIDIRFKDTSPETVKRVQEFAFQFRREMQRPQ